MARINNIVLVHGAFVDGSSWAGLYDILKEDGFDVSVVQNPTHFAGGRRGRDQSDPRWQVGRRSWSVTLTAAW